MANYYAFTKNGKPVLGSPLQGKKPRGGKSIPVYLGGEASITCEFGFLNGAESLEDTDSYQVFVTAMSENGRQVPYQIGWVYTGSRLTTEKFIKSINAELNGILEFTADSVGNVFIVRSQIGAIMNCGINFVLD